ncbi:MAG: tetratricopeptide repeat protein [Opitutae bacterium]
MTGSAFRLLVFLFCSAFGLSQMNGESSDKLFYDAVRAEASGDLEKAIEIYSNISQETHSANLHANLANLFFKMRDYARSILHFRKAIWIEPGNRDYRANLSLALEMSGIHPQDLPETDPAFSPRNQTFWLIGLSIFVWSGLLLFAYFFPLRMGKATRLWAAGIWITGTFFLCRGFVLSHTESTCLNREVIALHPSAQPDKFTDGISLRVFAGDGSAANTHVPAGSSLFLDLDAKGFPRIHQSQSGEKWFLARSYSGSNKGWIKRDEFDPVLDLGF